MILLIKKLANSPSNISKGNNNDYIVIETESTEKFDGTEISYNSKNTQDTGNADNEDKENLFFLNNLDKNKKKGIKFEYKHTDFEEGDMITSYIEHQIEKKLKKKYPSGIPKNISPSSKDNIHKNKIYEIPKNIKDLMNRINRREK